MASAMELLLSLLLRLPPMPDSGVSRLCVAVSDEATDLSSSSS